MLCVPGLQQESARDLRHPHTSSQRLCGSDSVSFKPEQDFSVGRLTSDTLLQQVGAATFSRLRLPDSR